MRMWLYAAAVAAVAMAAQAAAPPAVAPAGKDFDLQGFIDGQAKSGNKKIVVPPGRYRVTPKNRQHLVLRDLQDVQIIADGVEMICTETTRALTIANCRNVTLRGLVIDYDPLPFTQGRITAMSADKKTHEIAIFDGYPGADTVRPFKYEIFRPDTRTLRCPDYGYTVEKVDARHIRVIKGHGSATDLEQVGDIIVIGSEFAPGGSAGHAVECSGNAGVRLENIDLYASNCFGFIEVNCDGSTYWRCRIDRRPAAGDPVKRADPRIRSLNADAFHSISALKGPALVECVARFMGDDAVNIHGTYHMITECRGAELRVLAKGDLNLDVGDPVELMAYDGTRPPDAKVSKVEPDGRINDAEKAFLLAQRMDENIRTKWNAKAYKVTLDRAVDLPTGSLLAAARRTGNGFLVQGCDFGFNRSRGILIKASNGKVVGNKLSGSWMSAVMVAPEYWWLESGSSNNVEITGNVITDCGGTGIAVFAEGGRGRLAPAGAHNRIVVSGNTFSGCPMPNICVTSTDDVRIERNAFKAPTTAKRPPFGLDPAKLAPVITENCTNAIVKDNAVK
jgi:hypothetical protein